MAKTLKFEWFFPHEKEVVWECLTTPELITKWLMANDFAPRVGHKFEFRSKPQPGWSGIVCCEFRSKPQPGWSGIVYCEVLEVVPNKRLSYSWKSGSSPEKINMSTIVTWTLTEQANGTKLNLVHDGFAGFRGYMISKMMGKGWNSHIAKKFAETVEEISKKHSKTHSKAA
jgi:uncharacterized protein YndB with AHSA1/START domain